MAVNASSNDDLKAEINVTPLVDVVLVLLIIFMVVTPMLKQEVPIELPIAANSRSAEEPEQVTLSVSLDGRTAINGADVPGEELASRLSTMYAERADKTIFLEADRDLSHGRVVEIMDDCRAAGVERIGVITKRDPNAPPPQLEAGAPAAIPVGVLPDAAKGAAAPAAGAPLAPGAVAPAGSAPGSAADGAAAPVAPAPVAPAPAAQAAKTAS